MDTLTFIVEIVKATTWPLAAIAIALVFRGQIKDLAARVRKGKLGPAEFEFEQQLKDLRHVVIDLSKDDDPRYSVAEESPAFMRSSPSARDQVLNKWLEVERSTLNLAEVNGFKPKSLMSRNRDALQYVSEHNLLPSNIASLTRDLMALRNKAAHEHSFDPPQDAIDTYLNLANEVLKSIADAECYKSTVQ